MKWIYNAWQWKALCCGSFLVLSIHPAFGQPGATSESDSIPEKIQLINNLMAALDTLSPFEGDEGEQIILLNSDVESVLLDILNDPKVVQYHPENALNLSTTKSPDNKVIIFSFSENTGGSYKSNINILYLISPDGRPTGGKLNLKMEGIGFDEDQYGGSIDEIVVLKSKHETKYLALGGGISCNTCEFSDAVLFHIEDDSIVTEFTLHLDYRMGMGEMNYNPQKKTIQYWYEADKDDSLYGGECEEGRSIGENLCRFEGLYRFRKEAFVKIIAKGH
jgi:hypothetical protein